jgi:hypothetical protein
MKENTALSPEAQAVLDAFTEDNSLHDWKHNHYNTEALAAAIRMVVVKCGHLDDYGTFLINSDDIHAIATELEAL